MDTFYFPGMFCHHLEPWLVRMSVVALVVVEACHCEFNYGLHEHTYTDLAVI